MTETVAQVRHVLDVFDLPVAPAHVETETKAPVSVLYENGGVLEVPVPSALGNPEPIADALDQRPGYLVLNGALGDRLLMTLLRRRPPLLGIIVADPTRVLVERNLWRRWRRQGGLAHVRRPVRLLAVTTNPYSPVGQDYAAHAFFDAVNAIANRPVFDMQAGFPE